MIEYYNNTRTIFKVPSTTILSQIKKSIHFKSLLAASSLSS